MKDQPEAKEVIDESKAIDKKLTAVEEALYQTKNKSIQDTLNFPIRLNNKLSALAGTVSMGDYRPTDQSVQLKDELSKQIDAELARLKVVLIEDVPRFNNLVATKKVPAVIVEEKK